MQGQRDGREPSVGLVGSCDNGARYIRVCAVLLVSPFAELRLWYVPPDLMTFVRRLYMAMAIPLGSRAGVCEVLEFRELIEETSFDFLPST